MEADTVSRPDFFFMINVRVPDKKQEKIWILSRSSSCVFETSYTCHSITTFCKRRFKGRMHSVKSDQIKWENIQGLTRTFKDIQGHSRSNHCSAWKWIGQAKYHRMSSPKLLLCRFSKLCRLSKIIITTQQSQSLSLTLNSSANFLRADGLHD